MSRLSYKKYERTIKNLIRDYLDGYLTYSNYIDKATEVYDLAWCDDNLNTDEYMVLTLLVQASSVVYDECKRDQSTPIKGCESFTRSYHDSP